MICHSLYSENTGAKKDKEDEYVLKLKNVHDIYHYKRKEKN